MDIVIYGNKYRKKRAAWAALKNFYDICPIIPVGVECPIRQPSLVLTLQWQFLLLQEV